MINEKAMHRFVIGYFSTMGILLAFLICGSLYLLAKDNITSPLYYEISQLRKMVMKQQDRIRDLEFRLQEFPK